MPEVERAISALDCGCWAWGNILCDERVICPEHGEVTVEPLGATAIVGTIFPEPVDVKKVVAP